MQETEMILSRLMVVKIEAHIWGGRKKLRKEDLILADGSELPPDELASLGSKKIADPQELAVFNRLKKEAERICLKVGTRFLGGFAVPEGTVPSLRDELDRISASFTAAKGDFLSRYDQAVDDWVAKHPKFAESIRRAVDPVDVVSGGLQFDYVIFKVTEASQPESEGNTPADGGSLARSVGSLSESLFREIAKDASDLLDASLLGREIVTRKALRPFKRIRDKLDGLGFLDHRVQPVVTTIDELLGRAPKVGDLDGTYLQSLLALALLLSDPNKIRKHGDGLLEPWETHQPTEVPSEPAPTTPTPADLFPEDDSKEGDSWALAPSAPATVREAEADELVAESLYF